jgi:hypothetical protein
MKPINEEQMLMNRFVLNSTQGLQISDRVMFKNGILVNDYADKFMPAIHVYKKSQSELFMEVDILDSVNTTLDV